jgi:hypothetical protein
MVAAAGKYTQQVRMLLLLTLGATSAAAATPDAVCDFNLHPGTSCTAKAFTCARTQQSCSCRAQ